MRRHVLQPIRHGCQRDSHRVLVHDDSLYSNRHLQAARRGHGFCRAMVWFGLVWFGLVCSVEAANIHEGNAYATSPTVVPSPQGVQVDRGGPGMTTSGLAASTVHCVCTHAVSPFLHLRRPAPVLAPTHVSWRVAAPRRNARGFATHPLQTPTRHDRGAALDGWDSVGPGRCPRPACPT